MPVLQPTRGVFIQPTAGGVLTQIASVRYVKYRITRAVILDGQSQFFKAGLAKCFGVIYFSDPDLAEYLVSLVQYSQVGNYDLILRYAVDKTNKAKRFKSCIFGGDQYGMGSFFTTPFSLNNNDVPYQSIPFVLGNTWNLSIGDYIITTVGNG